MIRFDLSRKICNMLKGSSPKFKQDQNFEEMGKETLQSKQICITKLVQQAGVDINLLNFFKNEEIKLDFRRMQSNLNQTLLGQYVMKTGLQLTQDDLRDIRSNPF